MQSFREYALKYLGFESTSHLDVCLELLCGEFRGECLILVLVKASQVCSKVSVGHFIAFVDDYEEEIET